MAQPEYQTWIAALAKCVAATLSAYRPSVPGVVEVIALDCHPWNGLLELSLLTHDEVARDTGLNDPKEMASWKHYNFSDRVLEWTPARELGAMMRPAYEGADDHIRVADDFFRACAIVMAADIVQEAVAGYNRSERFRISVSHPDDGREFYPPA